MHVKLVVVNNLLPFTEATNIPKDFQDNFFKIPYKKVALNSFLPGKLLTHDFGGAIVFISLNREVKRRSLLFIIVIISLFILGKKSFNNQM